jgi:LysM repeat protein
MRNLVRSITFVLLAAMLLSACNLESSTVTPAEALPTEVPPPAGPTEVRPTITSIPSPTIPPSAVPPTSTPVVVNGCYIPVGWIRYIVVTGDTLYGIADRHNSNIDELVTGNCLANANQISLGQALYAPNPNPTPTPVAIDEAACAGRALAECSFEQSGEASDIEMVLILLGDNGENGHPVGCNDSAVTETTDQPSTGSLAGDIRAMLETMLPLDTGNTGPGGYNALFDQNLFVRDVRIENEMVIIELGGTLQPVGACGDALMEAQLVLTAFHYPQVKSAQITVGGQNLRQIFDATGLIGADAIYSANDPKWDTIS